MEDIRLLASATDFFIVRVKKLEKKEKQGFLGWDEFGFDHTCGEEIRTRAKMKLTQRNLINISNFCNFLWQMLEDRKED